MLPTATTESPTETTEETATEPTTEEVAPEPATGRAARMWAWVKRHRTALLVIAL